MKRHFILRQLFRCMLTAGVLGVASNSYAAAFQLWEQDGASVGNYHAGRAAIAEDASTAYYNPAGIPLFKNQQFVFGDVLIISNIKYSGTVTPGANTTPPAFFPTQTAVAQGGAFNQVPDLHYIAPLSPKWGFGFSVVAPFGLETNYGLTTPLRYAATLSQLRVIDFTPSLGYQLTPTVSVGAGIDIERMGASFNQVGTMGFGTDSNANFQGWDTKYGVHVGVLYQFLPSTRAGLTYQSQVVHRVGGTSNFSGPIANLVLGIPFDEPAAFWNKSARVRLVLPPLTTFSLYHDINPTWSVMGTAIYTQWHVVKNILLTNAAAPVLSPTTGLPVAATNVTVEVPLNYRNTWNVAVGANYHASDKVMIRTGLGYDQSPVTDAYRNVQVPDNDRIAIAFGGHYQATKTLGFDLGYTHFLVVGKTIVNPPPQATGGQVVATNGTVSASADVFSAQVTWDFA